MNKLTTGSCFYILFLFLGNQLNADFKETIRYNELSDELTLRGITVPDGSGVDVTQVEAYEGTGNYLPNDQDDEFTGKTIVDQTGGGSTSNHANNVGKLLYGNSKSISPGVQTIDVYSANDYLNSPWRTGTPPVESNPLQNHSWVGWLESSGLDSSEMTLRMDYAAVRDSFLPIAGLDNSDYPNPLPDRLSEIPPLYASIYNGISVGVSDSTHRIGTTQYDGLGRTKPEIVAPSAYTSFATPIVTSAAAFLIDAADGNSSASAPLTLKATLLAGADKSISVDWDQTPTRPIDEVYGAGELDIYESYSIQQAGQQANGSTLLLRGWNLANLSNNGSHNYTITVPDGFELHDLSALITWNRQVSLSRFSWRAPSSSLADLSLQLSGPNISSYTSDSAVDNIEHIWRGDGQALSAGSYTLTVATDDPVEYALAWRSRLYQDYALWQASSFSTETILELQDPEDDPDGDGFANLLEQALGGDPETPETDIGPELSIFEGAGESYLQISFTRPVHDNAIDYTVETTTDLNGPWSHSSNDVALISISSETNGMERYTYRRVAPISAHEKAFLRVAVSPRQ
ncbi:MAG: hypothetical protein ACON39_01950 [Coraliomargaritaceae bacterium]